MGLVFQNKIVGITLYLVVLVAYIFAAKASSEIGKNRNKDAFDSKLRELAKFRLCFFTIWNFGLQIFFLITAILDELARFLNVSVDIKKRLGRTRAFIFNTFVFPCSLLVMTIFWSIWHIDRELIFPKVVDDVYPTWLNHTLHTVIAIPLVIELLLPKRYSFVQFKNAALVLTVYMTIYQFLYLSIYIQHGVWLYPIYNTLNWTQKIIFMIFKLFICLFYQKLGIAIQNTKKIVIDTKVN